MLPSVSDELDVKFAVRSAVVKVKLAVGRSLTVIVTVGRG
jgi:hypothetical protein